MLEQEYKQVNVCNSELLICKPFIKLTYCFTTQNLLIKLRTAHIIPFYQSSLFGNTKISANDGRYPYLKPANYMLAMFERET